jgi:Holliday junction resolvase RusA-like endonuclease
MTRQDKWKNPPRPAVARYWAFKDEVNRQEKGVIPKDTNNLSWIAYIPIPKSWTKAKKIAMAGVLHRQTPDRDNIDKAILDALFKEDSGVATGTLTKRWDDGAGPRIELWWHEPEPKRERFDPHHDRP